MTGLFDANALKNTPKDPREDSGKGNVKITEVPSSKPSFKEVPMEEYIYTFTCKRCGNHFFREVPMSHSKFGGPGLSSHTIKVCKNCDYSESEER